MRWLISINRTKILSIFTISAVMYVFWTLAMYASSEYPDLVFPKLVEMTILLYLISVIMMVSVPFSSFTHLGDKRERTLLLMLPATNAEKFSAVVIYTTIICPLICLTGIEAGDLLRMALEYFTQSLHLHVHGGGSDGYHWWSPLSPMLADFLLHRACLRLLLVSFFFMLSLCTLNGTLYRKYNIAVSGFFLIILLLTIGYYDDLFEIGDDGSYTIAGYVFMMCVALLTVFNYWASYRIFKGFQIITNKWTNYDILK